MKNKATIVAESDLKITCPNYIKTGVPAMSEFFLRSSNLSFIELKDFDI
jgi:hypothetical protein